MELFGVGILYGIKMEDKYIIDNNVIWEMIKDQFEETGEVIDNMKVYRLKKPITPKEQQLLDKIMKDENTQRKDIKNSNKE